MENSDKELVGSLQYYAQRLNMENWLCRRDLDTAMRSPQLSSPRADVDPNVYKEFFKYTGKLAEKFTNWGVLGYVMTTQSYSNDASGNIGHSFGRKTEDHPIARAARLAPEEFKDFAVSALACAHEHSRYDLGTLIKNKEAFGLKDGDVADILHNSLERRAKDSRFGDSYDKDNLPVSVFYKLMADGNETLLKDFMTRYPKDFENIAKTTANYGCDVLRAFGDGERYPVKPEVQEWIDKNPKVYGDIVQTAVTRHCLSYHPNEQKKEFDGVMNNIVNKDFLANNPDFVAQTEQKQVQAAILKNQQGRGRY